MPLRTACLIIACAWLFSGCAKSSPLAGPAPASAFSAESSGPDSDSCRKFIASLPEDFQHGFVTVPENPQGPNGTTLRIFYYGKLIPGEIPVAVFNGGPASNSWGDYRVLRKIQDRNPAYAKIPFIYIDQRGTGCSTPYPEIEKTEELTRLALYASAGIVSDAEAVRKTLLGNSPWKIFGQSYGGMIAHRYVMIAPRSLVSVTAHGFALTEDPLETLAARIHAQNRIVASYLEEYPEDAEILAFLDRELTPDRCFYPKQGFGHSCGKSVLAPFFETLGFVDRWSWIHRWLVTMKNQGGIPQQWIDQIVFSPARARSAATRLADKVIWNQDMNYALKNRENCERAYDLLESRGENPARDYLNECQPNVEDRDENDSLDRTISELPRNPILPEDFKRALLENPGLPFYLYSGELDPYSPVAIFKDELAAAGSLLHYTDFVQSGHDGFYSEPSVWHNL